MSDPAEESELTTPADLLTAITEMGLRAQGAVLQAELDLLAQVVSGLGTVADPHPPATDAEVESGFDNMPV
jgi:hypothetical protein